MRQSQTLTSKALPELGTALPQLVDTFDTFAIFDPFEDFDTVDTSVCLESFDNMGILTFCLLPKFNSYIFNFERMIES